MPYYDLNEASLAGFIAKSDPTASCQPQSAPQSAGAYCKTTQQSRQAFQPWTAQVRYFGNDASSNYESLQVKVRRQFSAGFSLLANYAWGTVFDFDNEYYPFDPLVSRGIGNFDRKHSFLMTNMWDIPVGRGRKFLGDLGPMLNRIFGGWSLSAITSLASGLPFTPKYSECSIDIGTGQFPPCRPNLVGPVHVTGSRTRYFTTTNEDSLDATCAFPVTAATELCPDTVPAALQGFDTRSGQSLVGQTIGPWQRPGAGQIGNAGRNSLRGPAFFQANLAVAKNVSITKRAFLQFRADAFNVFNTVNLGLPNPSVDSPFGGQITSLAVGAVQRQMQFSLRLEF